MRATAVQRLSGTNCIVLPCGTDGSHPRTHFTFRKPKQMRVNFPRTLLPVHFGSISTQGKWSTGCSPLARRAPDKLRVRHCSSSSFQYSFKQNYTDDSSRGDLISARDKPIPKGVDTTIKIAFKYNNKKA